MPDTIFQKLQALVAELPGNTKTAAALSEPEGNGATGSDSQHPSASMDDGLTAAKTGPLYAEKSQEVKGLGQASIDAASPPAEDKPAETREASVGLTVAGVGRDPATEDRFVGSLPEPGVGTSTGAKFDDGNKYAASEFMKRSMVDRSNDLAGLANDILAGIAVEQQKIASATNQQLATNQPPANQAAADALIKEAEAGYELASVLGMEKWSEEQRVQATLDATIRDALLEAELVGEWIKQASLPPEEAEENEPPGAASMSSSPDTAGAGGPSPEMIQQALGGGGGGEMPPGAPPMDAGVGGSPDGGGAGISKEEAMQELLMAMQELGITPEDLAAVATQGGGGPPGGGAPPAMGGGEPPLPPQAKQAQVNRKHAGELAKAAREFQRSGKFEIKVAATPRERNIRNHMKQMLGEMIAA